MIKHLLRTTRIALTRKPYYRLANNKMTDLIEQLTSKIHEEQLVKDEKEEEILRNYIELTEESYLEHLMHENKLLSEKKRRVDPAIVLMALPTLEKEEAIRQHLLLLFPHVNTLNAKELMLFFEYLLAHKMTLRPKVPPPKPLNGCEGLLVILAQLYAKDFLIQWLKQVPLYEGNNSYMLAMAAFSVISGLSEKTKTAQQKLISRCLSRIGELFEGEDSEVRTGMILLALEANLKFAQELALIPYSLDFKEIDGIKISLLVIQLDHYIKQNYESVKSINPLTPTQRENDPQMEDVEIDEGVNRQRKEEDEWRGFEYSSAQPGHIKFKLEEYLQKLVRALTYQDWKGVIKLHTLTRLFSVLHGKQLERGWLKFSEKLFNFTIKNEQVSAMTNLTNDQVISMLEVLERLKVNRPPLIKSLLVVLSQRLETASKEELIRLAKCLVTYVRLCQDYLLHFRVILQRRKFIFSAQDIEQLNLIFRRVQVLFPKPLTY